MRPSKVPSAPISQVVAKSANPYTIAREKRKAQEAEREAKAAKAGTLSKRKAAKAEAAVRYQARQVAKEEAKTAKASRVPKMTPEDLALFSRPIALARLPRNRTQVGGYAWPALVAQAQADGLICSPGKSVEWVLTDKGRKMIGRVV